MKNICTIPGAVISTALFFLAAGAAWGQGMAQPKAFFESAKLSLDPKDSNVLQPKSGTLMKPLTSVQNVADLRSYVATSDSGVLFPGNVSAKLADKLQRILRDATVHNIQLVALDVNKVKSALFTETKDKLCEGTQAYCSTIRSKGWEKVTEGVERMFATLGGKSEGKPFGQAIFIRDGADISGVMNVAAQIYLMRQISERVFAITTSKRGEVERLKDDVYVPKHTSGDVSKPVSPGAKGGKASPTSAPGNCPNPSSKQVLEVVVMSTDKARKEAFDAGHSIRQLVRTAEALGVISFRNSDINGEIRVTQIGITKYTETGDLYTDVQELQKEGGRLDDVRKARRDKKADVGVLVVDHPDPKNCGMAAGISVSKEQAFVVVNWRCLTDKFSFIHEIGHLAGAYHDPATVGASGSSVVVAPPYAHGYVTTGKEPVATIMAYREACSAPCGREWYWSNPNTRTDDGQVLGTADKNFDACIWRQRLPVMSTFDGG